jgi:hypothetical protein
MTFLDSQLQTVLASKPLNTTLQDEYAAANWLLFFNSANVGGLIGANNGWGSGFATAVYQSTFPALTLPVAVGVGNTGAQVLYGGSHLTPCPALHSSMS